MDWKTAAIEKLKQYEEKRQSLELIPVQIAEIESAMTSIRSAGALSVPVMNSKGNSREDMYINNIDRLDELKRQLEQAKLWIKIVDRGLSVLNREERLVLERLYINREKYAADRLCDDLGLMDSRTVYKRRDQALRLFTVALYGCVES